MTRARPSDTDPPPAAHGRPLTVRFFGRDPREVAPDLIGCIVVSTAGDAVTSGRIVETEAYLGADDPGSHASTRGITKRNAVMFGPPGVAYVYFTYGNHHMLNIVCAEDGVAGAVLIRALEPLDGIEVMRVRRNRTALRDLCSGPGRLAQALGLDLSDNGVALGSGRLQVYDGGRRARGAIVVTGRVGLSAGHELDLRYHLKDDPYVSRGRLGPLARPARTTDGRTGT